MSPIIIIFIDQLLQSKQAEIKNKSYHNIVVVEKMTLMWFNFFSKIANAANSVQKRVGQGLLVGKSSNW